MLIQLDTSSLTQQFDVTSSQVEDFIDAVVKDITLSYARKWEQEAKQNLRSTRSLYIQNLKIIDEGRMKGAVLLDYSKHKLVRMLEEGANAFDIKEGFAKSAKRHRKKNGGWYMFIPFRMGVPTTIGESDVFNSHSMPGAVYSEAREQKATIPTTGGTRSPGLKLTQVPTQYQIPKSRAAVGVLETKKIYDEYTHKSSMYQGLMKKTDAVTGQNTYMTFRAVSDKSDDNSWIHTGILAYNLADKAMDTLNGNMQNELTFATERALASTNII